MSGALQLVAAADVVALHKLVLVASPTDAFLLPVGTPAPATIRCIFIFSWVGHSKLPL